jgi:monoamine oxidase
MTTSRWLALYLCGCCASVAAHLPEQVDVAIIGAGWAGLVAARTLALHNAGVAPHARISYHILEATDHVGGRTLNEDASSGKQSVANEHVVELGGEWLAPTHHAAIDLMNKTLGFKLFHRMYNLASDNNTPLKIVVNTAAGVKYCNTDDEIAQLLPNRTQAQIEAVKLKFQKLAQRVPCNGPLPPDAAILDGISFDAWIQKSGATDPEAINFLSEFADDAEATNAMSLFGVAWTYNCSQALVGDPTEDQFRVENGTQGPVLTIARTMLANITLEAPVTRIQRQANGNTRVESGKGDVVARHVLVAGLSPPVYARIEQGPPLPAEEFQLLSRLSLGTSLKYMLVYDSPWWRSQGNLGKIVNTFYPEGVYISECLDDSPGDWSKGVLMCFIEGSQNRDFFKDLPTMALREAHVVDFVGKGLKNRTAAANVLRTIEHNWADFPYTRGAYTSFFSPGVLSNFWDTWQSFRGHNASRAMERLWLAGSDYSGNGMGYIDGAITSGRSAAQLIIKEIARPM